MNRTSELPRIGAPATRTLKNAGVLSLEDLTHWTEVDLLALHGVGPKAIRILREHLDDLGLAFKP
jgi:predicted flap endonuclease-1-like 5' DNA nuclease